MYAKNTYLTPLYIKDYLTWNIFYSNTRFKYLAPATISIFILIIWYYRSSVNSTVAYGSAQEEFISRRLSDSETLWKESVLRRHKIEERDPYIVANPWDAGHLVFIWDLFYTTFNCPHQLSRLGRLGDGGKWVCGVSHLRAKKKTGCIIYSFGINGDTSFENDILNKTSCTLRAFDHTVDEKSVPLMKMFPGRSTFRKIGLAAKEDAHGHETSMRTLLSEMKFHGDTFIDILKFDIEGSEFQVLTQLLTDFPNGLPFGQLLIEIHMHRFPAKSNMFKEFRKWWESLEKAGLRALQREPNFYTMYLEKNPSPTHMEFTFLNVQVDHVILHAWE